MKCRFCNENYYYNYNLKEGTIIPVCFECGRVLYGKNIGEFASSELIQMQLLSDYISVARGLTFKYIRECECCHDELGCYDYTLNDGTILPVGEKCGKLLYGKNIGSDNVDHLFQIIDIQDYIYAKVKKYTKK